MRLANKVAVITGGGSGMGQAVATLFASEGARTVIGDINDAGAAKTVASIGSGGGKSIAVHADVSTASGAEKLITVAGEIFGKIDILFNGAGIGHKPAPVESFDESLWDRVFAVNVKSVFLTAKFAAPMMKEAKSGAIVNMASIVGVSPRAGSLAYGSSKAAVILLTKALALEFAPFNVRVNCINPGMTDTPFVPQTVPEGADLEQIKAMALRAIPLGRLIRPEEIAQAALYLVADESAMITGTAITIDGGRTI